jgi:hypothetical protein
MADDTLKIQATIETAPLNSGVKSSAEVVQSALSSMRASFASLFASTKEAMQGVTTTVKHAAAEVGEATKEMSAHMIEAAESAKVSSAGIGNAFGGMATLMGGALIATFFAEFIHGCIESVIAVRNLSEMTGIAVDRLSALEFAAGMVDVKQESLDVGLRKLAKTMDAARDPMSAQAELFKRLGIDTKEWRDELPPTEEALLLVADKFASMKNGAEKTALAMQIFGRSGASLIPLLNQGSHGIEEMTDQARTLGAVVTQETVKSVTEFDEETKQLSGALKGIMYPALVTLLEFLKKIAVAFYLGQFVVMAFVDTVKTGFKNLRDDAIGLGTIMYKVLTGDFKGAKEAAVDTVNALRTNWQSYTDSVIDRAARAQGAVENLFGGGAKGMHLGGGDDDAGAAKAKKPKDDAVSIFEDELNKKKLADQLYKQDELARDLEFWKEKLKIETLSAEDQRKIRAKVVQLTDQLAREQFRKDIDTMQYQIAEAEKGSDAKIRIAEREAARVKEEYGQESPEYANAQRHIVEITKQVEAEKKAIRQAAANEQEKIRISEIAGELAKAEGEIEREKIIADAKLTATHASANDRLKTDTALENKLYQAKRAALQKTQDMLIAFQAADPANPKYKEQLAKLNADIEKLDQQHKNKVLAADIAHVSKKRQLFDATFSAMSSAFQGTVQGIISGTKTIGQGIADMGKAMLTSFAGTLAQMFMDWVQRKLAMLIFGKTIDHASAASGIAASAATGAAAAGASVAAIPLIGWSMVPAVSASTYGILMAYQGAAVASAAGGWDSVQGDQMAKVHDKEMILPADIADPLRQNLRGGRGMGGFHYSPVIQTLDRRGVADILHEHRRDLVKVAASIQRGRVGR